MQTRDSMSSTLSSYRREFVEVGQQPIVRPTTGN